MRKIKSLQDVSSYQLCCGCGACAYLYPADIEMRDAVKFGRRPYFFNKNSSKTYEEAVAICPGINLDCTSVTLDNNTPTTASGKTWGPILEIWEGHASDPDIRFKGSSGGAINAIALYCLEEKLAEGVLHTTPDKEKPYLNNSHISSNRKALLEGAGSRYSPASPCEKLGEVEKATKPYVIIGKPCDIAATYNLQQHNPTLDSKVALTIACFCAGTPSTQGTLEMLRQMGCAQVSDIKSLRFRGHGWPGRTKIEAHDASSPKKYRDLSYEESWGTVLQKYRQWRCYICPDHTGEFADIAVGDPWYHEIEDEALGKSLILVRSEKGKAILQGAIEKGYIIATKMSADILPASQPNLVKTRSRLWGQLFALCITLQPTPHYKGFYIFHNWNKGLSITNKLQSIASTIKRIGLKKLYKKQTIFDE